QRRCPLADSVILRQVLMVESPSAPGTFLRSLTCDWLPHATKFTLLYRGSRDGSHAKAFHAACDDKGPTLTLVHAHGDGDEPIIVGGYTQVSWQSPSPGCKRFHDDAAFVFRVIFDPVTRAASGGWYPIRPACAENAIYCGSGMGPTFSLDLSVAADTMAMRATDRFVVFVSMGPQDGRGALDDSSYGFEDETLREQHGVVHFSYYNFIEEIEVFGVS
ncbi:MAG: TLD domain-containing protein, partial [Formivibrio sp.]|nr:TLD domain-containing protein [Formivibrio sp.]